MFIVRIVMLITYLKITYHIHLSKEIRSWPIRTHTSINIYTHALELTHAHTRTDIHTHTHTHAQTNAHTRTHTHQVRVIYEGIARVLVVCVYDIVSLPLRIGHFV